MMMRAVPDPARAGPGMTDGRFAIRRLDGVSEPQVQQLADLLIDCVEGGASVSFMRPLGSERALAFWRRVADGVHAGARALLVAEDDQGICGSVQLILDLPENQPHRADLAKMLVHRRARRRGLGEALMRAAEGTALDHGRHLLVLDAVTGGDAARLYERLGWQKVGDIPDYALYPDGAFCSTTYYFRRLIMPDAYSSPLAKKLNLKGTMALHVIGKPGDVNLGDLAVAPPETAAGVLLFAARSADVEAGAAPVIDAAKQDRLAWIAYPKGGKLGTDLNRDILWKQMQGRGIDAVRQVAIDETWSALRFRPGR